MKLDIETERCLPNNVKDIACMVNQPTVVIEKVSKTVRLLGFLIQNGVSKSNRVMQDVQELMKRGKNIWKALNNVVVKHHEALTCRPRDADMYLISPLEYPFSCSSSPPRLSRGGASSSRRKLLSPAKEDGRRKMKVCQWKRQWKEAREDDNFGKGDRKGERVSCWPGGGGVHKQVLQRAKVAEMVGSSSLLMLMCRVCCVSQR